MKKTKKAEKLMLLRNGAERPVNENCNWTRREVKDLMYRYYNASGISDLALHFGRSETAVMQKLMALRCFENQVNHRDKKPKRPCHCNCQCLDCSLIGTEECLLDEVHIEKMMGKRSYNNSDDTKYM